MAKQTLMQRNSALTHYVALGYTPAKSLNCASCVCEDLPGDAFGRLSGQSSELSPPKMEQSFAPGRKLRQNPMEKSMLAVRNPGRIAGFWYLLLILLGPLRLIYIPNKLFVAGDAAATVNNIATHERLFRLGIADDLLAALVLVFVTLAFYRMFVTTSRSLAALVVIFGGIMPAVLYLTGAGIDLGTINVIRGLPSLATFTVTQQHAIAMFLLRMHDLQNTAAETLWGAWMLPLGVLVYRSRLLPRFMGIWVFLGGLAYLVMSFTGVLASQYNGRVFTLAQPFTVAEIALTLWLLIRGSAQNGSPDAYRADSSL